MKKGDLFPVASEYRSLAKEHRVQYTGEYRNPKRKEWYISGAIPEGYLSPNDLSHPAHIGKLVRVKVETRTTVTVIPE